MSCVGASTHPKGALGPNAVHITECPERTFALLSKVTGFSQKAPDHVSTKSTLYPLHLEAGLSLCIRRGN